MVIRNFPWNAISHIKTKNHLFIIYHYFSYYAYIRSFITEIKPNITIYGKYFEMRNVQMITNPKKFDLIPTQNTPLSDLSISRCYRQQHTRVSYTNSPIITILGNICRLRQSKNDKKSKTIFQM